MLEKCFSLFILEVVNIDLDHLDILLVVINPLFVYLIAPRDAEPLLDLGMPAKVERLLPLFFDGLLHDIRDLSLIDTHIEFESWVLWAFTLRARKTIA